MLRSDNISSVAFAGRIRKFTRRWKSQYEFLMPHKFPYLTDESYGTNLSERTNFLTHFSFLYSDFSSFFVILLNFPTMVQIYPIERTNEWIFTAFFLKGFSIVIFFLIFSFSFHSPKWFYLICFTLLKLWQIFCASIQNYLLTSKGGERFLRYCGNHTITKTW